MKIEQIKCDFCDEIKEHYCKEGSTKDVHICKDCITR